MLDIVSPQYPSNNQGRRAKPRRRHFVAQKPQSMAPQGMKVTPGPKVVTLDWRLPARLRRPIRDELRRERKKKAERQAIVKFEKHDIYKTMPPAMARNKGIEHHTGDIYMHARPAVQVSVPPYVGSFVRRQNSQVQKREVASRKSTYTKIPLAQKQAPQKPRHIDGVPRKVVKAKTNIFTGERDVPFDWNQYKSSEPQEVSSATLSINDGEVVEPIVEPKRRFALPLHFSIFPLNLWPKRATKKKTSRRPIANIVILIVGCALLVGGIWNLQALGRGYAIIGVVSSKAKLAYSKVMSAQSALAENDFSSSQTNFQEAQELLQQAQEEYNRALSASRVVLEFIDVTGTVRSGTNMLDAAQQVTEAGQHLARGVEPLLNMKLAGGGKESGESSLVSALQMAQKEFQAANANLTDANRNITNVNVSILPSSMREQVGVLKSTIPRIQKPLSEFLNQSDMLLVALGAERQRQYLLLFENNSEQRPTGGFIGSIALVNVDRGAIENVDVQTVYDPDGQLKEFVAPPEPLRPIVNRWYMRDSNWFVDWEMSAQKTAEFFEKEGGPTVDGVIAMTPEVIKSLLKITGPIEVPGYNVTVTPENFVPLTQDLVTYSYDKKENKPKKFLADLAPILLNKVLQNKSADSVKVLGALSDMMRQKQLLVYFTDSDEQQHIQDAGWSAAWPKDAQGFLSVNNANIGGHKSDQFIEQEIDYRTDVKSSGDVEATVTIRRTHRGPEENLDLPYPPDENPAFKDNVIYQRVFVPKGAKLLEVQGYNSPADVPRTKFPPDLLPLTADPDVAQWQSRQSIGPNGTAIGEEAGYTFFGNWIITKPGATTVTLYRYLIPRHADMPGVLSSAQRYSIYVAKQAGDMRTNLRAEVRLPQGERIVHTVPQDGITQVAENQFVYRGVLNADKVAGAVFESQ